MRAEFSKAVRRQAYERANGFCERCDVRIWASPVEYHHLTEAYLGGDNSLTNCLVVCLPCHVEITAERHPAIDKTRRLADRRMSIKKRKSRLSHPTLRRKMSGEVVPK